MLTVKEKNVRKEKIEIRNPYSGKAVGSVPAMERKDVVRAVAAAKSYDFSLSAERRSDILLKAAAELKKQKQQFAELITGEIGIALKDALHEVDRAGNVLRLSAEEGQRMKEDFYPSAFTQGGGDHLSAIVRDPVGVVCCITPFNHPLNQVVHKVAPAIAANNAVVLKPSEKSPLTALKFAQLLWAKGLPREMLQVVTGDVKAIGLTLIQHPDIGMISFTGGTSTGELIMRSCGIKKLSMELGGNDAFVVLPDADVEKAAQIAAIGAFGNSGQRCSSIKRIITFPQNAQAFAGALVEQAKKLKAGDPMDLATDIGTVISEAAAKVIEGRIRSAVKDGAKLLIGGKRDGALLWPTVLDEVDVESELVAEETFGPVAPIIRARNFEEAIGIVNATRYGLNAGIMTNDMKLALEFSRRVNVGGVRINQAPSYRNEYVPFGGNKMSGFGRSGVKSAIEEMTNLKTIIIKK